MIFRRNLPVSSQYFCASYILTPIDASFVNIESVVAVMSLMAKYFFHLPPSPRPPRVPIPPRSSFYCSRPTCVFPPPAIRRLRVVYMLSDCSAVSNHRNRNLLFPTTPKLSMFWARVRWVVTVTLNIIFTEA